MSRVFTKQTNLVITVSLEVGGYVFQKNLVVGEDGIILTSPNAISWTSRSIGTDELDFWSVTWGGDKFVAVGGGGTILTISGEDPVGTGSIQVRIVPVAARNAGAKWRLTTGPDTRWKNHNTTIRNLPAGTYIVQFKNVSGWTRPPNMRVRLGAGDNLVRRGTYRR